MSIETIANRLVELNRTDDYKTAYAELFADDVISIENWGSREVHEGMGAVRKKGEQFMSMVEEMHSTMVSEPLIADNSFAVTFTMDATFNEKMVGMVGRHKFTELAVYRVNEAGKIYHEEFFG